MPTNDRLTVDLRFAGNRKSYGSRLTDGEQAVMDGLTKAWNAHLDLDMCGDN